MSYGNVGKKIKARKATFVKKFGASPKRLKGVPGEMVGAPAKRTARTIKR